MFYAARSLLYMKLLWHSQDMSQEDDHIKAKNHPDGGAVVQLSLPANKA